MYDESEAQGAPKMHRLQRFLDEARKRLIQTGTRNRLVHVARFAKRGKGIDIVEERSDEIFKLLVLDSKRLRFDHDPSADQTTEEGEPELARAISHQKGEERFADNRLQTQFGQDKLQKKLLGLAREAKTLEEEQGINALYLALGFLRWFEDEKSEIPREAPLVLVPVNLRRNDRTSRYELEFGGDDIVTNEPLKRRLADDFGIKLAEISEAEEWQPSEYFAQVAQSISGQSRWSVDEDGMQLGFFSFAKLLMVRDLEPDNWTQGDLLNHPVVQSLLADGFEGEASDFSSGEQLDKLFAPADLIQVVDADASQTLVIETVRKGRNLVVQGPPGTGKSQTITNIIASAVHDGKTVLFVAEKMAALNVVRRKLVDAGLEDICLELHSRSANKKAVLQALSKTLEASAALPVVGNDASELQRVRDKLNSLSEVMHTPIGDTDVSAYRVISTLVRLRENGFSITDHSIPNVETWHREKLHEVLKSADALTTISDRAGSMSDHPFLGVRRTDLLPTDIDRLQARLEVLADVAENAGTTVATVSNSVEMTGDSSPARSDQLSLLLQHVSSLPENAVKFAAAVAEKGNLDKVRLLAESGLVHSQLTKNATTRFSPVALEAPVAHLRPMLASGYSFFGRFGSQYRSASAELQSLMVQSLPKDQMSRLALLDELVAWQNAHKQFGEISSDGFELLGELWQDQNTDFSVLGEAVKWTADLLQLALTLNAKKVVGLRRFQPEQLRDLDNQVSKKAADVREISKEVFEVLQLDLSRAFGVGSADEISFDQLVSKTRLWLNHMHRLDEWSQLLAAHVRFEESVGPVLAGAVVAGEVTPENLGACIRSIHAEALYRVFVQKNGWITSLTAEQKAEMVGTFRQREKGRWQSNSRLIRGGHLAKIPRGGMGAMGTIRAEIGKKRAHRPIRRLMTDAGSVIQQLKPVFLMSPISVAQYLPPGLIDFDLLVIDEASQVRPEDALGAVARSRQIVVVGDRKQLPPTSFFDRVVSDVEDEEDDESENDPQPRVTGATELESVLTLCEARGLNSRMLEWHYRSRHPSLIEVSNDNFYEGRLVLFPSPLSSGDEDGLHIERVNGAYDRGGKRNNPIEAEAVARAVAEHAQHSSRRTLGVVTFSTAQRDQVTFWLDKLRQDNKALDLFMREGRHEELFVKNIENVQGDERDVIFISVGYGPRVAGTRLDSMAFGPVSSEGGERRLNVLFTRARYETKVFASFDSGDIDLSRTKMEGPRVLKNFLQFAETGQAAVPQPTGNDPDSDFEISVASAIRQLGYQVDYQVGSAGFRIDLAVHDPVRHGRYLLAVECDGATYHSAVWARERDRQRQEVLESLGWSFHRVWSTDWFHRRENELGRLKTAIAEALEPDLPDLDLEIESELDETQDERGMDTDIPGTQAPQLPQYTVADFSVSNRQEPHEVPVAKMKDIVVQILQVEGPIHQDEVARRVATLFGKQKAGSRIAGSVIDALKYLESRDHDIQSDRGFWFTRAQALDSPLRNRSNAPPNLRKASMLPPIEIAAAIKKVLSQNGALSEQDIPRAVALLLGFQRTGPEFRPAIEPIVEQMLMDSVVQHGSAGICLAAEPGE